MHAERDYLRSHVFPRLEEDLRARRHLLEPIDLRLGVETAHAESEEARERVVLKVCLEEITRSRPFMIVLLGDRYGWVPPDDRIVAAAREQALDIEAAGKSVTALEIEFGLRDEHASRRQRTLFFFRRPLPYESMPADVAAVYSDAHSSDVRVREDHVRLQALKRRLRDDADTGPRVFDYSASWDPVGGTVTGLEAFGALVYRQLWAALDQETAAFAGSPALTWQERERAALAEFVEQRGRHVVGREPLIGRLQELAEGRNPTETGWGLCITGPPGTGKSAVFAELYTRLATGGAVVLLANAAGGTPHGARVDSMLRRWIEELAGLLHAADPIPGTATPEDIEDIFYDLLRRTSATRRVAVLLDALDQAEPTARGTYLTWFKRERWPGTATILATTARCAAADALTQWAGIDEEELPGLTEADVPVIARAVWRRYHREINPGVVRALMKKRTADGSPSAGNPQWLTVALEQLNLLDADDFARADRDFQGSPEARLLALVVDTAEQLPAGVEDLYGWVLARNEKAFGEGAASAFAAGIAMSRSGWREADLVQLIPALASTLHPEAPAPAADDLRVAELRRGFRAHVVRRSAWGQLDFCDAQMREAVAARYLADEARRRHLHGRVSDYLETLGPDSPIVGIERMRHLIAERDARRAARYYATTDAAQPAPGEERVGDAWTLVEWIAGEPGAQPGEGSAADGNSRVDWMLSWLDEPELGAAERFSVAWNFCWGVLSRLSAVGGVEVQARIAGAVEQTMLQVVEADPGDVARQRQLAVSHKVLGDLFVAQGNLLGALDRYRRGLAIEERLGPEDPHNPRWMRDLSVSHEKIGKILVARGDLPGALDAFMSGLAPLAWLADAEPGNPDWQRGVSAGHDRVGDVLVALGRPAEALEEFRFGLAVAERLAASDPRNEVWQQDLSVSCQRVGDRLHTQGDGAGALAMYRRGMAIDERLAAADPSNAQRQRSLAAACDRVDGMSLENGPELPALRAFERGLAIRSHLAAADPADTERQRELAMSHHLVGQAAMARGDLEESLEAHRRALTIRVRLALEDPGNLVWQSDLMQSCDQVGCVLQERGNQPEALDAHRRGLAIARRLVARDPANAEWQRDLAVVYYHLAQVSRYPVRWAQRCRDVLRGMQQAGMHLDEKAEQLLGLLDSVDLSRAHGAGLSAEGDFPGERSLSPGPGVSIPTAHPDADPERAAQLNMAYHRELQAWKAMPWWKRIRTRQPAPPSGI